MLANKLMSALSGGEDKLYVDDVFSTYTYNGSGSNRTIDNGIDLAGEGGMVWTKSRNKGRSHKLVDTVRGVGPSGGYALSSNSANQAQQDYYGLTGFTSSGYTLGNDASGGQEYNTPSETYVSWTFRKAPKFFDVVTFTSGSGGGATFNHALTSAPGMVVVKQVDGAQSWYVFYRRADSNWYSSVLNSTAAGLNFGTTVVVTDTSVTIPSSTFVASKYYVAYLFAHDPSADGIIHCGSYTGNPGVRVNVNIGWEPQFLLVKRSSDVDQWVMADVTRGIPTGANTPVVYAESSGMEAPGGGNFLNVSSTGFYTTSANTAVNGASTYIYLAIRRPNKPPTTGTQVYKAIARNGTGAAATVTGVGFSPDLFWAKSRTSAYTARGGFVDRLRGGASLEPNRTEAETSWSMSPTSNDLRSFDMDGFSAGLPGGTNFNTAGTSSAIWLFKRAPGFFDVVCYTGTGSNQSVSHGLGVAPALMIGKARSSGSWAVYVSHPGTGSLYLELPDAYSGGATAWGGQHPTATTFRVGSYLNDAATTYLAYLFATRPGVSKIGNYTGNGASQTIPCGFTTGARFILIKRTDSAGDWYVWDTVRGVVAGSDPHLSFNTTAAEVTTNDSIDPDASGFIVNQVAATNINVDAATYIFLAIA